MQDYLDQIKDTIAKNRFNWLRMIRCRPYLIEYINMAVSDDFKQADLKTQVYALVNNLKERPICPICKKPILSPVKTITDGFDYTCGRKECYTKASVEHMQETCLKRYGTRWSSQVPEIQAKIQENTFRKYGVNCVFKSEAIKAQMRKTNLEKYGVDIVSRNEKIKEKIKKTCLERYGVEYTTLAASMKEKSAQTCLERYGVLNGGGSKQALNKIRETVQKKYGYNTYFDYLHNTPSVKQKMLENNIRKYGFEYPQKSDVVKQKVIEGAIQKYGCSSVNTLKSYNLMLTDPYTEPCFTLDELDKSENRLLKFKCKKCGHEFMSVHKNGMHSKCDICFPHSHGTSDEENEVYEFLHGLLPDCEIIRRERLLIKPLEVDMYIPSKRLAIEFDGLYWHSTERQREKNYHLSKTEACLKRGVQLIHIFENEWIVKKDIVKSRLMNILGIYNASVFARKCAVREIDSGEAEEFVEKYHMQGSVNGSVRLGLFDGNQLLAVMTFSKPRFTRKYEWELLRYCVKSGYHIPGGAGKLLAYFERHYHPLSLVSYADRRWSTGGLYESLGFKLMGQSRPNYWYFQQRSAWMLESRVKYQKHKLSSLLETFDDNLSEQENMRNNGFLIIYDCGNLVYTKEYSI